MLPTTLLSLASLLPLLPLPAHAATNSPTSQRSHPRHNRHRQLAAKRDDGVVLGGFQEVGNSGISAQMLFLGTESTAYILDKSENNSMTVTDDGGVTHPAWGVSYDLTTETATAMQVNSNTFCAAGLSLATGEWAVFGGNQAVTYEGVALADSPSGTADPYKDASGGAAIRLITPCDDGSCKWQEGGDDLTMTGNRWYPSVENLGDGSLIVIGGDGNGGYVSTQKQNNPTYEFYPKTDNQSHYMDFLNYTVPVNLFPLTWLLPGGKLFMQAAYKTILYDIDAKEETPLPDMPYSVRVYPASAANAMLPLTPANNYSATILFCGGSAADFNQSSDGGAQFNVTAVKADDSCVRISPEDDDPQYEDDDSMFEGRSMGQFVYLPDGTMWMGNGVGMGTAGYGDDGYSIGQSYGQEPLYTPAIYDPSAPQGSRWNRDNIGTSNQERMYHSSAILLPDSSLMVSGSNPNKDVTFDPWPTSYSVERWYPFWYNEQRPEPSTWPTSLTYGGDYFNVTYTPTNSSSNADNTKVVVIRGGFSTHAMNFGQRFLELNSTYTKDESSGEVTIHASQMPPNANIFPPGPAMIFLVVDGVPSTGKFIMIGSGAIETQPISDVAVLPATSTITAASSSASSDATGTASSDSSANTAISNSTNNNSSSSSSSAAPAGLRAVSFGWVGAAVFAGLCLLL
ncbi:hypothetical protein I350_06886 [Cryptococcus amylolentus CBS 6273]|uniref:Glyoxal oxidase n=1 Tax=Cryptococcus amylolentus CBS 6273 TaxID=1296118 RepID=A0A1E3JJF6_9TREE|nr:hypothetical protein I350_06886 [Cryptococcus amylolentus CBS 6273]